MHKAFSPQNIIASNFEIGLHCGVDLKIKMSYGFYLLSQTNKPTFTPMFALDRCTRQRLGLLSYIHNCTLCMRPKLFKHKISIIWKTTFQFYCKTDPYWVFRI